MRFALPLLACLLLLPGSLRADPAADRASYSAFRTRLFTAAEQHDPVRREALLDDLWSELRQAGAFPFVAGDSVAFLYRGPARTVTFTGDFDGWNPEPPRARRLGAADVWLQEEVFPGDARLDYKVVLDGSRWRLDPENPRRQRSGFGDNSELPMPDYRPSPWVVRRPGTPAGELTPGFLKSEALGYPLNYQVYTPAGYAELSDLPVLVVTDGHEYADDALGSLVVMLDNLIAAGRIRPLLAVFIDPRVYGQNRRAQQYVLNENFVRCVADELVPVIDAAYRSSGDRRDRGILGTSLGGLNSAWFALRAPAVFGCIGVQSPAFQAGDGRIVDLYREAPCPDADFFITWGTLHDFGQTTQQFLDLLEARGCSYTTMTVNEGHSWGQWRALLDDLLIHFWPGPGQ